MFLASISFASTQIVRKYTDNPFCVLLRTNNKNKTCPDKEYRLHLPDKKGLYFMKKLLRTVTLSIFLSLAFQACNHHSFRTNFLQMADTLVNNYPDSVLVLLEQIGDQVKRMPESTRMRYHLLTIKARDKAYLPHLSDSLIKSIVHYYRLHTAENLYAEALYYAGRVHCDLQKYPRALEEFLLAAEKANKTDYRLKELIYSQIGSLYLRQGVSESALPIHRKAYHYASLGNNPKGMVFTLRDIGRTYAVLQCPDSAIHYYKAAQNQALRIKNPDLAAMVSGELAGYYTDLGLYAEAYSCIQTTLTSNQQRTKYSTLSILSGYYEATGQLDSAAYYYRLMLQADSYLYKQTAYQGLGNIARRRDKLTEALACFDQYLLYTDSLEQMKETENLQRINALYNYQQFQRENAKLRHAAARHRAMAAILALSVIFLCLAFATYRQYRKRKEQEAELQQTKLQQALHEQRRQSQAQVTQNLQKIHCLEQALQQAREANNAQAQAYLLSQKKLAEKTNEQIEAQQEAQRQAVLRLKHSAICHKFYGMATGRTGSPAPEDWQALAQAVNEAYDNFTLRLQELHPLNETEREVCLLLKIGLTPVQIATLTARSKQAVSSVRRRLYTKTFGRPGRPEDWDEFIGKL